MTRLGTLTYDPPVIAPVGTPLAEWITPEQFLVEADPLEIPPLLRVLLTSDGSMTTMLQSLRLGPIDVEVIRQGEEPIDPETALRLGVRPLEAAITRHVWLSHAGQRLLYAVSVLPTSHLNAELAEGIRRGVEPLGRLLDACGRPAVRDHLRIGRLQNAALADTLGAEPSVRLWCRTYRLAVEHTLTASIVEVFSPRLIE